MTLEDKGFYNEMYKPLEWMPEELAAVVNADLIQVENEFKIKMNKYVENLAKAYILSPYTQIGMEFKLVNSWKFSINTL